MNNERLFHFERSRVTIIYFRNRVGHMEEFNFTKKTFKIIQKNSNVILYGLTII